eukprot:TRINITY_DN1609_c0_g6_i1.p1 TRINITY_DN1609_c0_g6~~TRINITY_DN1609_c0_g6_i1.p1  ORF type:complete len:446 (+),score=151.44 TRINITY_DN1609_c0_g6_i1:97-1338(+)
MATTLKSYRSEQCQGVSFWVPDRYKNLVGVGSGSYGNVCKATDAEDNEDVAIKRIGWTHNNVVGKDYWIKLLREIRLMVHFHQHENLLFLKEIIMPPSKDYDAVCLVSKFMKTDLNTLLAKCPSYFNAANIFSTMYAMLNGLFAMHSATVMHRDLKPSNILVDGDGTVRLADFGLGRDAPDQGAELTNYVVTRWYRAPEILLGERYSMVVDIWSLGCVFAELLAAGGGNTTQRILFPSRSSSTTRTGTKEHINMILDITGHEPTKNDSWMTQVLPKEFLRKQAARSPANLAARFPQASPESLDLLCKMLTWDPNQRPSARMCFRHEYWGEYAWSEGNEDDPWPPFDGTFSKHCTGEEEARRMVNLEITRFHPEWSQVPGVDISRNVSLRTAAEGSIEEDFYGESDVTASMEGF